MNLPPQSLEIEAAVLGAFLLQGDVFASFEGELSSVDFYDSRNIRVMEAISEISNRGGKIDILTVAEQMKKKNIPSPDEATSWPLYISKLTNNVGSTANLDVHIKIVRQNAIKRNLISMSNKILRDAYNPEVDVFDLINEWDTNLEKVNSSFSQDVVQSTNQLYMEMQERWRIANTGNGGSLTCRTGFDNFDKLIGGGFYEGNVITLAGRPGMGKTTIALQMARNVARSGKNVGIITLEMSALELFAKIVSGENKMNNRRLLRDSPNRDEHEKLDRWSVTEMKDLPIFYIDAPSMNTLQFKNAVKRLVGEYGCEFVIVDYLQLMEGDKDRRGSREQEVASISRTIKSSAKRNKIPILSLSQLNRGVETRGGDKRPQLADLRESGAIEQDSDMVIFAYRPEYYGIECFLADDGVTQVSSKNKLELIVAKNRNGAVLNHILGCDLQYSNVYETSIEDLMPLDALSPSDDFIGDLGYQEPNPF